MAAVDEKRLAQENPAARTTGRVLHAPVIYDLLAWLLMRGREGRFRQRLIDLAHLDAGETVLDVGCGTGTLAIAAKERVGPSGVVHAVDASPEMIARAVKKGRRRGVDVTFRNAVVEALPYPDRHFDVVLSTLMLHHLPRKARQQCAREIARVLKPGGRVLVVDFGAPMRKGRGVLSHFHRHGHVALDDVIQVLSDAGFGILEHGAVGIRDLQFVLAAPGFAVRSGSGAAAAPRAPNVRAMRRVWVVVIVATLLACHAAILYLGSSHLALSAGIGSGVVIFAVATHLGWLGSLRRLLKRS
jgi:ubiquinone/menaquinone biosynthesis C-methylase UbiE